MEPGEIYRLEIDLWYTSHVFQPGHRIRIELASSAFPKYARNTNTGNELATDNETVVAENIIYHGGRFDSHVLLPVIPLRTR
jgi:putative CocE/NonD family hydrolase